VKPPLEYLAEAHLSYPEYILGFCAVLTVILSFGLPQIELQTDFQASLPDDIPAIQAQDKVEANFDAPNAILLLVETTDDPVEPSDVTDVRDPRLIETLQFLEDELRREPLISSVNSLASLFDNQPESKTAVRERLAASNADLTNRDYTATTVAIQLTEDMTEENIRDATAVIEENLAETPTYPGVSIQQTGLPVMRSVLSDVLVTDTVTIIAVASLLILALLAITRGIVYGTATFLPLFIGLIWALGAMGLLGIPMTIATVSIGSMLLGLGVEYGSFIGERIIEEMRENGIEDGIRTAVPNTGKAVLGSSVTDLVGFLALLFASISFMRDLGLTLALGEALTLTAALLLTPALIVSYERWRSPEVAA
jgi:predicted RND superfamily exporter protein